MSTPTLPHPSAQDAEHSVLQQCLFKLQRWKLWTDDSSFRFSIAILLWLYQILSSTITELSFPREERRVLTDTVIHYKLLISLPLSEAYVIEFEWTEAECFPALQLTTVKSTTALNRKTSQISFANNKVDINHNSLLLCMHSNWFVIQPTTFCKCEKWVTDYVMTTGFPTWS